MTNWLFKYWHDMYIYSWLICGALTFGAIVCLFVAWLPGSQLASWFDVAMACFALIIVGWIISQERRRQH